MKRLVLGVFVVLAACTDKPATKPVERDANAPVPQDQLPVTPYTFGNFNDPLGRYWLVAPMSFAKVTERSCTKTDCLAEIIFRGDGITIRGYALPAADERRSLADEKKAAPPQTLTREKTESRGYSFWLTSADGKTLTWVHQVPTFIQPIRIELKGPADKRSLLDDIAVRLATVYDAARSRPPDYCTDLPWTPAETRKNRPQKWAGRVAEGPPRAGAKTFYLELDKPVCDTFQRAVWEIELAGVDPSALFGKHVIAEGSFESAGDTSFRPLVTTLTKINDAP